MARNLLGKERSLPLKQTHNWSSEHALAVNGRSAFSRRATWLALPALVPTAVICLVYGATSSDASEPNDAAVQIATTQPGPTAEAVTTADSKFTCTLPSGLVIQLVCVAVQDGQSRRWWQPDGKMLSEPLYDEAHSRITAPSDQIVVEFTFRLPDRNAKAWPTSWRADSTGSWAGPSQPSKANRQLEQYFVFVSAFPKVRHKASVDLGFVGNASWTVFLQTPDATGDCGGSSGPQFAVLSRAYNIDGQVVLGLTHNLLLPGSELRVVAIDARGGIHVASEIASVSVNHVYHSDLAWRNLSTAEIKRFEVQQRSTEWARFPDVVLRPDDVASRGA